MKKLFTLLTLLVAIVTGTWADAITVTWLPNNMSSITKAGTASVADILTVSDLTTSSDLADPELKTFSKSGDYKWGNFIPTTLVGTNRNYSKDDYITFSVTVKSGYTFYPTSVSAYAVGSGTGNNAAKLFSTIQTSNGSAAIANSSGADNPTSLSLAAFSSESFAGGATLNFYIYVGSNATESGGSPIKGISIRDVVLTGTYEVAGMTKLDTPAITVNQATGQVTIGSVENATKVTYTTDGTDPTASSTEYTAAFTVDANCTIKAIAIGDGASYSNSNIASQAANITVEDPVITAYNGTVGITCATDNATIKYNFDGGETWETYTIPFTLFEDHTVYAKAEHASYKNNSATVNTAVAAAPAAASDSKSITLYYDTETNFSLNTDGNSDVLTGKANTDYEGFSITLDNEGQSGSNIKTISYGSSINGKTSLKGSNGRKMTIAIPSNLRANRITLYSYNNGTINSDSYWSNVGGTAYTTANEIGLQSVSNASEPDVRVFALDNLTSIDIVNNGAQQQCFIAVVDYTTYVPGPADATTTSYDEEATITYSGGSLSSNTWTGTNNTDLEGYSFSSTSLSQKNSTGFFKLVPGTYTISVPSGVAVAKFAVNAYGENSGAILTYGDDSDTWTVTSDETSVTNEYIVSSPSAGGNIVFTTSTKNLIVKSITLYVAATITLTTSDNMAGWRAFYDADKSYTVDENTKIYTVTAKDETKATLTEVTGRIPAQTPVLLKTSDANRTMTLTAATTGDAINTTGNLLQATNGSAVSNVYRLGYSESGVGLYQYSATNPASGIVYLPANAGGGAKALTFSFGDVTGISNAAAAKAANAGTGKMYNLSGQIVDEGYKGIVIVNGKKVIK